MKRAMELAGTTNFRDLGGYRTDGRRVREGLVYRSDSLHNIPPAVAQAVLVEKLRVSHAFDLRSVDEASHKPYAVFGITRVAVPVGGSMLEKLLEPDADSTVDYTQELIHATYRHRIDHYGSQLGEVLRFLASPAFALAGDAAPRSIVFHCTAGKDRTGLVAALLLHLLGVPRETIMADYMLTGACLRRPAEAGSYYNGRQLSDAAVDVIWGIDPAYLSAGLAYVEQRHGSIDAYAANALGVDAAAAQRLRGRLFVWGPVGKSKKKSGPRCGAAAPPPAPPPRPGLRRRGCAGAHAGGLARPGGKNKQAEGGGAGRHQWGFKSWPRLGPRARCGLGRRRQNPRRWQCGLGFSVNTDVALLYSDSSLLFLFSLADSGLRKYRARCGVQVQWKHGGGETQPAIGR